MQLRVNTVDLVSYFFKSIKCVQYFTYFNPTWIVESLEKKTINEFTELFKEAGVSKFKIKKLIISHKEGDEFVGSIEAKIDGISYASKISIIWDRHTYSMTYDIFPI